MSLRDGLVDGVGVALFLGLAAFLFNRTVSVPIIISGRYNIVESNNYGMYNKWLWKVGIEVKKGQLDPIAVGHAAATVVCFFRSFEDNDRVEVDRLGDGVYSAGHVTRVNRNGEKSQQQGHEAVGRYVHIQGNDDKWYEGEIVSFDETNQIHTIRYLEGEEATDLSRATYEFLDSSLLTYRVAYDDGSTGYDVTDTLPDGTPRIRRKGKVNDVVFSVLDTMDGEFNQKLRTTFECGPIGDAAFRNVEELTGKKRLQYLREWSVTSPINTGALRLKVNTSFVASGSLPAKVEGMVEKHIELLEDFCQVSDSVVAFVAAAFGCLAALAALPFDARDAIINWGMALGLL